MEQIADGPAERPLRRDAERNRRRILDAAAELFAERGLSVSLDDIAHHAQVGVGTVYRRFPDRDALIDALFDDQLDAIVAIAEESLQIDDAWDGLEHFLITASGKQAQNRGLKELLLGAPRGMATGCVPRGRDQIERLVVRLVERAQQQGTLRADFSPHDAPLIQLMIGSVADYTRDVDPQVWRRLLTIVLDGLRADGRGPSAMPAPPLDRDALLCAMSGRPAPA